MTDRDDVLTRVTEAGVRLVDLQFSDIAGGAKALTVPVELLASVLESGYRFDGAALTGGLRTIELDLFLVPDLATLRLVPGEGIAADAAGRPRARFSCAVRRRDGGPFAGDPRAVLERAVVAAAELGLRYRVAIEMEYYLLPDGAPAGTAPVGAVDVAGYFGVGEDAISATRDAVMLALTQAGVSVGGAHHETGPGQEEIDLNDVDALVMADQLITVRQVIRSVARRHGLRATFMPKPMAGAPGSGVHIFQGFRRTTDGSDALSGTPGDGDGSELSPEAGWLIGGQLRHAAGMSLITNPTVNSYKRLNAGHRAPRHATWARVSQASLIRVPTRLPSQSAELELRSPDALANPYLALAVALGCGLDGVRERLDPPEPLDETLVSFGEQTLDRRGVPRLPTHLGEAIAAFEADDLVRATLGEYLVDQLLTVKRAEWEDYRGHVSPWELDRYADA